MIISHTYKLIFFSNPKTGSESIRAMLTNINEELIVKFDETSNATPYYSHMRPVEVKESFLKRGLDYDSYRKFVVVRNPWARLVSTYENIYWYHLYNKKPWFYSKPTFEKWLKRSDNKGKGGGGIGNRRWLTYGTYSIDNYASDENGDLIVDKILMLEDIDKQARSFFNSIGLDFLSEKSIPKINTLSKRSPENKKKHIEYYNEKTNTLVEERYQYEIEAFKYKLK